MLLNFDPLLNYFEERLSLPNGLDAAKPCASLSGITSKHHLAIQSDSEALILNFGQVMQCMHYNRTVPQADNCQLELGSYQLISGRKNPSIPLRQAGTSKPK